jgi:hypothetical protein
MSSKIPQYLLEKIKEDEKSHPLKDLLDAFLFVGACITIILFAVVLFIAN